jgi:hypothetical protein
MERRVRSMELVITFLLEGRSVILTLISGYCDAQCARDLKYINGEVHQSFFSHQASLFLLSPLSNCHFCLTRS